MTIYGIYSPRRKLKSVQLSISDAWDFIWYYESERKPDIRSKYWKRQAAFRIAMRKAGWRIYAGSFKVSDKLRIGRWL